MPRNLTEAAITGTAVAGGVVGMEYIKSGVGIVIGLLTVAILIYRFLITRREWRDGRRRKDNENLPHL